MAAMDARQRRKNLLDAQIKACRKCKLPHRLNEPGMTESAPGFGSVHSPVAIVGEALCRACMEEQEPFHGGSGRVLDRCFARAGVDKTDLFITNSIHCHPPGDRDPLPHESENCAEFLRAELRDIVRHFIFGGHGKRHHSAHAASQSRPYARSGAKYPADEFERSGPERP